MKYCKHFLGVGEIRMTPSFIGRTAVMWPGVRPSMFFGFHADRDDDLPPRVGFVLHCDHRGFVQNDTALAT